MTMAWEVWLAYAVACVVIAVSPGSGAVLSMTHGLAYGVQRTTATILGLQIGLVIVLLIAGVGVGAVLVASATAFTVVKVVGAAYLFWLGFQQWRAPVLVAAAEAGEAAAVSSGVPSVRQRLVIGTMTNLTNPKGIVFMVAVLPQFIDPSQPTLMQYTVLALVSALVDILVMGLYAAGGVQAAKVLTQTGMRRLNRCCGATMLSLAAFLAVYRRS